MTEIRSLNNDLKYGELKEEETLDVIRQFWGDETVTSTRAESKFCKYDFKSDYGRTWEVKSRRCDKHKYATTIIPVHKIRDTQEDQYFLFNFTDCSSFIRYDKDKFATYKQSEIRCFRQGAFPAPVLHYEIPVKDLTDILAIGRPLETPNGVFDPHMPII
jgi:hypothetical protein